MLKNVFFNKREFIFEHSSLYVSYQRGYNVFAK